MMDNFQTFQTYNCDLSSLVNETKHFNHFLQLVDKFVKECKECKDCSSSSPEISKFVHIDILIQVTKYEGPEKSWEIDMDDHTNSFRGDKALIMLKNYLKKISQIINDCKQIRYFPQLNMISILDSFNDSNGNSIDFRCNEKCDKFINIDIKSVFLHNMLNH
jgi:hypothetical protein